MTERNQWGRLKDENVGMGKTDEEVTWGLKEVGCSQGVDGGRNAKLV